MYCQGAALSTWPERNPRPRWDNRQTKHSLKSPFILRGCPLTDWDLWLISAHMDEAEQFHTRHLWEKSRKPVAFMCRPLPKHVEYVSQKTRLRPVSVVQCDFQKWFQNQHKRLAPHIGRKYLEGLYEFSVICAESKKKCGVTCSVFPQQFTYAPPKQNFHNLFPMTCPNGH